MFSFDEIVQTRITTFDELSRIPTSNNISGDHVGSGRQNSSPFLERTTIFKESMCKRLAKKTSSHEARLATMSNNSSPASSEQLSIFKVSFGSGIME